MRASDEERERAASEIREHFAHGRLTADELADRIGRAYSAQTTDELAALQADLPAFPRDPRAELAARRSELSRHLVQQTGAALVPFAVCVAVWLSSGAHGGFWPIWVALVAVIPLLRNGWRLYGPAPDLESVERELRERRRQHR